MNKKNLLSAALTGALVLAAVPPAMADAITAQSAGNGAGMSDVVDGAAMPGNTDARNSVDTPTSLGIQTSPEALPGIQTLNAQPAAVVPQAKPYVLEGTVVQSALPVSSLKASVLSDIKRPGKGPASKYLAIKLSLINPGDQSLILDGENATAYYGSGLPVKNVTEKQTVADASNMLTGKQKAAVALITLGTASLAGPLFYEWIMGGKTNPKLSLGEDEIRRRIEGIRLGSRVMLPNETASGSVFLPAASGMPKFLVIPILSFPGRASVGVLRVDIAAAASTAAQ